MLNTRRLQQVILLFALSQVATLQAQAPQRTYAGAGQVNLWLADSGNPWALPAPESNNQQGQNFQRKQRFITPEEMNSIYKKHDQDKQAGRNNYYPGRRPEQNYYSPGTTFDPLIPGGAYPGNGGGMYSPYGVSPGIGGGTYSPYGVSPFYTPNYFNNVAPFIY